MLSKKKKSLKYELEIHTKNILFLNAQKLKIWLKTFEILLSIYALKIKYFKNAPKIRDIVYNKTALNYK